MACGAYDRAAAAAPAVRFHIEPKPTSEALLDVALQANVTLIGAAACAGYSQERFAAAMTVEQALDRLLSADASCTWRMIAPGAIEIAPIARLATARPATPVTVARGRVEVGSAASIASGGPVALAPGQRLAIDAAGVGRLTKVDPAETFAWRAGRLVYRAQPLADVVADLNRQFVEQTEIADPELGKLPITGVVVLDNPRAVVARLSLMLPIKALPSDKGLILLRK